MRLVDLWVMTGVLVLLGACGADEGTPSGDSDAADDVEFADWKPSGKDAIVPDATDATDAADVADAAGSDAAGTDAAGDAPDVPDVPDAAKSDVIADVGGGLPSEITAITPAASLFDVQGLHEVKLTLNAGAWTAYMAGVDMPDSMKVYNWYQADVEVDGVAYASVGIKGFGNGSQIDNPSKPNVRIKFDQFVTTGMGPQGEKAFRLKASGQDPTFIREPIAGAMLRALGGNGPRFSWAHVTINGADFGPYELQESVDKRFFHNFFGNNDGTKFEPVVGCLGIDCPASGGCAALKPVYVGSPGDALAIVDAAQAITNATDEQLPAVLDQYFYTDELLADYAVDALLSNLDGFASAGQNFTFYGDEKTKKFHLIATGVDLTFGNFADAWYDLLTPWGPPNAWCGNRTDQLYLRIWANPVLKAKLLDKFQALQCGLFKASTLLPIVESYQAALKPFVYSDPKGIYTAKQIDANYVSLAEYITKRQKTLSDLLGPCK